ncbi:MAG: YidB family protein [Acidobacteriota bacterium]
MNKIDDALNRMTSSQQAALPCSSLLRNNLLRMLLSGESHSNGLLRLVRSFQSNGLGHIVASWVGTGPNLPISAAQVQIGLGQEQLQQIADKAGLSPARAGSELAELLPSLVDNLTPEGKVPRGALLEQGLLLLNTKW